MSLARAKIGGPDSRSNGRQGRKENAGDHKGRGGQGRLNTSSQSKDEGPAKENASYSYDVRWRVMRECLEALAYIHSKVQI